ncbi:MAG: hypothetical protein GX684_01065 [Ruminococcaceae bacterium]|nr:hypothetical protein [Oscillospiraceae bacterium]
MLKYKGVFTGDELLPKDKVEELLGFAVKNVGHPNNDGLGMLGVNYYNDDKEKSVWFVCYQQPEVSPGSDFDVRKQYFENKESCNKYDGVEPIEGLGEDAYHNKIDGGVCVLYKDYSFIVRDSLSKNTGEARKDFKISLAQIAQANLQEKLGG